MGAIYAEGPLRDFLARPPTRAWQWLAIDQGEVCESRNDAASLPMGMNVPTKESSFQVELHPEAELLLICSRAELSAADSLRIQHLLETEPSWETLLELAGEHRVWSRLHRRLLADVRPQMPEEVSRTLEQAYEQNARQNRFFLFELIGLLGRFRDVGLPAIPFKGPVLALSAHGALADRCFEDLDILVSPEDFSRAENLLGSLGYDRTKQFEWESSFVHPRIQIAIDLHHDIAPPRFSVPLEFADFWRKTRILDVSGTEIRVLSAVDDLLVLCVQLVNDWTAGRRRLSKLLDIDASVRAWKDPEWDRLIATARQVDALGILLMGLGLVRKVLDTPLPSSITRRIETREPLRDLLQDPIGALFEENAPTPDLADRLAIYWHLRERLARRMADSIEIAKIRIGGPAVDSDRLPWPSRLLLHGSLRPAWHAWWFVRRLANARTRVPSDTE